jgi:carbon storage regulator
MLVIRRKRDQSIHIGDGVEVTILDIENGQVKLGIKAPREVPVFREETAATRHSNRGAALSATALQSLGTYSVPNSKETRAVSISDEPS